MATLNRHKTDLRGMAPLLEIDRRRAKPIYLQIYEGFRNRIMRGELRPGQLVPSSRGLALDLEVSRIPVLNAYAQLHAEGYFQSRVGSGTFVSSLLPGRLFVPDRGKAEKQKPGPRPMSNRVRALPKYDRPIWVYGRGAFSVGQPALDAFPFSIWSTLVTRHVRNLSMGMLQYGDTLGLEALREEVASYLRTARGVHCEARQIMIVSGSQQALDVTARVLLDPGTPVWVEEPGYWLIRHILHGAGCHIVPIPVDKDGLDVGAGVALCPKARAVYVAPSHQYPLGTIMSASRRLQLLKWAQKSGAWIIEDDYDSEFRYDGTPISSLQGLDSDARVIYIGTFSKVFFPSLRLGYIVVPDDLLEQFMATRVAMDIAPPSFHQAVLADFMREGHFSRHVRRMRGLYRERRDVLMHSLTAEFGDSLPVLGGGGGLHLTILLPKGTVDVELSTAAAQRNLWLWPLSPTYVGKVHHHGFILGFGNTPVTQIPRAVQLLSRILSSH